MRNYLELTFDGEIIKLTTPEVMDEIIENWCKHHDEKTEYEPTGLWLTINQGRWIACYDDDGDAFVEDFKHVEVALLYLHSDYDMDELRDMDMALN